MYHILFVEGLRNWNDGWDEEKQEAIGRSRNCGEADTADRAVLLVRNALSEAARLSWPPGEVLVTVDVPGGCGTQQRIDLGRGIIGFSLALNRGADLGFLSN